MNSFGNVIEIGLGILLPARWIDKVADVRRRSEPLKLCGCRSCLVSTAFIHMHCRWADTKTRRMIFVPAVRCGWKYTCFRNDCCCWGVNGQSLRCHCGRIIISLLWLMWCRFVPV